MWGDGLPLFPATEERVSWILTGTDLSPDTEVGRILPRGGITTVEAAAVALAMTGGRPEYLPVLIAAVEAFVDPLLVQQSFQSTTSSGFPVAIVNGPIAKQIRLNSSYGCMGPSSVYPAGASIGRALRLIQLNLGGAIPGVGTMAIYGGAARYTNVVMAEDEDGLPPDWEPLNVTYWGYPRGTNTVGMFGANSSINVGGGGAALTEEKALSCLHRFAGFMGAPNSNYYSGSDFEDGCPCIVFFARGTAKAMSEVLGFSKEDTKRWLWENGKIPYDTAVACGFGGRYESFGIPEGEGLPLVRKPERIMVVVAGGAQSGHSYFMATGFGPEGATSAEIKLPANWDALLKQAEEDLGPLPSA
jgi:hypothetical protein